MATLEDDLQQLYSIEAFLDYFELEYDPKIVSVSRLHILKRFNQYLARESVMERMSLSEVPPKVVGKKVSGICPSSD